MTPVRLFILLCLAGSLWGEEPFQALAQRCLRAKAGQGTVRVLHFGDSHVAAGGQSSALRTLLRSAFGDGGPGFGLPWAGLGLPGVKAGATAGWKKQSPSARNGADTLAGPSGAWIEATRAGERAWLEGPFRRLRVYALRQPGGGRVRLHLDGRIIGDPAMLDGPVDVVRLDADAGLGRSHRLELVADQGRVRILGISLEAGPGAVYSALGHNGATANWLLRVQEPIAARILRDEGPDLVVLGYGTNEASLKDYDLRTFRTELQSLLERLRRALPAAAIMLTGPPDGDLPGEPLTRVGAIQRDLAARTGALFVDLRTAMGGPGSVHAWQREGLTARDRIHFSPEGYGRLARAGLEALFKRLDQARDGLNLEPALAKVAGQAFQVPALPGRIPASAMPVPDSTYASTSPRPIYTFRTAEGRLIITDDPRPLLGQKGEWIGTRPGS